MRNRIILLFLVMLLFSGCIKSKEHLTIKSDGSGELEVHMVVSEGIITLIENMFDGMLKGMSEAFGTGEEVSQSPVLDMFGNKEDMLKKATNVGLNIEFIEFNKELKGKDLYVDYRLKFDDINKFLETDIVATQFELIKDFKGSIVCSLKGSPQKAQESKIQMQQFIDWQESDAAEGIDAEMKEKIRDAIRNFEMEFSITLPNEINRVSGVFAKKSPRTAQIIFKGNILEDPSIINKLYGLTGEPTEAACSSEGVSFNIERVTTDKDGPKISPQELAVGTEVQITFKNGKTINARLIEETIDYIKVAIDGVPVTYYFEEIKRIEYILPKPQ